MDKLISFSANGLINYLVKNDFISEEKKSVYLYSATVAFQSAVNIIFTLAIGLLFGVFFENLCFFLVFKVLRKFAGGLHSAKYYSCLLISIISNIAFVGLMKLLTAYPNYLLVLLLELFSIIIVTLFAPITNENKKISVKERRLYKIILMIIILLLLGISILMVMYNYSFVNAIGLAMTLNSLLLIAEKLRCLFKSDIDNCKNS